MTAMIDKNVNTILSIGIHYYIMHVLHVSIVVNDAWL